jgi:hypothetical protein
VFLKGWEDLVVVVFIWSAAANIEAAVGAWEGARAARRAKES